MNGTRSRGLPGILVAAVLCAGSLSSTVAQEENRAPSDFGTDHLGKSLKLLPSTPLRSWDDLAFAPRFTMLVMIGRCDLGNVPGGLDRFIRNGGAVLIASDDPIANAQDLVDLCGHNVKGGKVVGWDAKAKNAGDASVAAGTDVANAYQPGHPELLKIDGLPDHNPPLFVDASKGSKGRPLRLITYFPGSLEQQIRELPRGTKVLARFPSGCAYDGSYLDRNATPPPFVVATEVDGGRLVLMADHHPLLNYFTLRLPDLPGFLKYTDNVDYLRNAFEWLRDDRRRFVLYVVDGAIQTELNPPTADDPLPLNHAEQIIIENANQLAMKWQAEFARRNRFNSLIAGAGENGMNGQGRRNSTFYIVMIAVLGGIAVLFGFLKLRSASHRLEANVPLLRAAVHRQTPPLSTVQHRQRGALEENNYGEHARALALEWFARLPGNPATNDAGIGPPVPPDAPPNVLVHGSWLRRLGLRNMVRKIWYLATDEFAPRMTRGQFHRVLGRILKLRDAVAAGDLRLEWNDE